jgi:predicted GNAT superfamily acetyltransferase
VGIEIRAIVTQDEYRAVEQIQRDAWGLEEVEIVPHHLLLTAQKNGGLVLGAFDVSAESGEQRLVGFVFGFVGLTPDGTVKHCSHMAGVASAYQNRNLGYGLKLAQRQHVLAQGLDLITWTFDPLESRNAYLNFRKLGAICRTYLRNLYGDMRDSLNFGLPSDRFHVEWHIASAHVDRRLRQEEPAPALAGLLAEGTRLVNPSSAGELCAPSQDLLPLEGPGLLIQVPSRFQAVKAEDWAAACAWREQTRGLFEEAFARGYVAVDLLFEGGRSYYLLQQGWAPADSPSPPSSAGTRPDGGLD